MKLFYFSLICLVTSFTITRASNAHPLPTSRMKTEWPIFTVSLLFLNSDFSTIKKDHFKCLPFLSGLQEFCPTDVCCRIFKMLEPRDKITLEDSANEWINLGIKCDWHESAEIWWEQMMSIYFFVKTVSQNVSFLRKIECGSAMIYTLVDSILLNLILAICVTGEDIKKQCVKVNQKWERRTPLTDSIATSRYMKLNENLQNTQENVNKTKRKKENLYLGIVLAITTECKPESKANGVKIAENGDLLTKRRAFAVQHYLKTYFGDLL